MKKAPKVPKETKYREVIVTGAYEVRFRTNPTIQPVGTPVREFSTQDAGRRTMAAIRAGLASDSE